MKSRHTDYAVVVEASCTVLVIGEMHALAVENFAAAYKRSALKKMLVVFLTRPVLGVCEEAVTEYAKA